MLTIELGKFDIGKRDNLGFKQPFTIAFVYTPDGSCVVKGMCDDVTDYIKKYFPRCFYRYTHWDNGEHRGDWITPRNFGLYINYKKHNGHMCYHIDISTKNGFKENVLILRRMVHHWLPIFDTATVT